MENMAFPCGRRPLLFIQISLVVFPFALYVLFVNYLRGKRHFGDNVFEALGITVEGIVLC